MKNIHWFFIVSLFSLNSFSAVKEAAALSAAHTCAIDDKQHLYCWGHNDVGQLGLGMDKSALTPLKLPGTYTSITVSRWQTCALDTNGSVKCFGDNRYGQLGQGQKYANYGRKAGETVDKLPAINFGTDARVKKVVVGKFHACALFEDGKVKCWGSNESGELGIGKTETAIGKEATHMGANLPYVNLGKDAFVEDLALNLGYSCALLRGGNVKCWGRYEAIGSGGKNPIGKVATEMGDNLKPVQLGAKAQSVSASAMAACALLVTGEIKCWGLNQAGILGAGIASDKEIIGDVPEEMGSALKSVALGGLRAVSFAMGHLHACAILSNHALKCWGSNEYGELGLGDIMGRGLDITKMGEDLPYVNLGAFARVESITLGSLHSCATVKDRGLYCWGINSFGQLGNREQASFGASPETMGNALPPVLFPAE